MGSFLDVVWYNIIYKLQCRLICQRENSFKVCAFKFQLLILVGWMVVEEVNVCTVI
jgi:hypothetical protein